MYIGWPSPVRLIKQIEHLKKTSVDKHVNTDYWKLSPATRFHWIWIEVKPRHQTHPQELFQENSFCNKTKKSLNPKYKRKNKYTSSTGRTLSKCSEHTTPDPDLKTLYGRQKEALACIYCSTATISTGFNFKQQFVEWVAQPPWSICSCSADCVGS